MQTTFAEVLEKIESFSFEEKETLVDILQNRLRDTRRQRVIKSVKEAEREFEKGDLKPASVDEIMKEILS
ncbi:MAG: hypothetical protein ACR2HG_08425 [Pyrinomonadaceae bacterium]